MKQTEAEVQPLIWPALLLGGIALFLASFSPGNGLSERIMFPVMAVLIFAEVYLLFIRKMKRTPTRVLILVGLATYNLLSLVLYTVSGDLFSNGLTTTAIWSLMVFPTAFSFLSHRSAFLFSCTYLFLFIATVVYGYFSNAVVRSDATNTIVQFLLGSVIFLFLEIYNSAYRVGFFVMRDEANTDPLTLLANRRSAYEELEHESTAANSGVGSYSVLLLDIDDFKIINDQLGHEAGDAILQEISSVIQSNIRKSDLAARWGGEEFLVLARGASSLEGEKLANHLRGAISEHVFSHKLQLTVSIGVSGYQNKESHTQTISRADLALYSAKRNGKNRVELLPAEAKTI